MLKYDKELECFLCPKCGEEMKEFEEGVIIQAFECEECDLRFDSNGDTLSEEELEEFKYPNQDDDI